MGAINFIDGGWVVKIRVPSEPGSQAYAYLTWPSGSDLTRSAPVLAYSVGDAAVLDEEKAKLVASNYASGVALLLKDEVERQKDPFDRHRSIDRDPDAQLCVLSDGTAEGTLVFLQGRELYGVTLIEWRCVAGRTPEAVIHIKNVEVTHLRADGSRVNMADDARQGVANGVIKREPTPVAANVCKACQKLTMGARFCWSCIEGK